MMTRDDGESIGLFEPLIVSGEAKSRAMLNDLALSLAEKSAAFSSSLPPAIAGSLADLVRAMNCYYSNLIEGHNTPPIDIERAMHDDYSDDAKKRDLQLEARAHIAVQKWIDDDGIASASFSTEVICEIHRRFCELLPPELLLVDSGKGDGRAAVSLADGAGIHIVGQDRSDSHRRVWPSSSPVGPPFPGRQRPRGPACILCSLAICDQHEGPVVDCAWSGSPGKRVQGASPVMRRATPR
jgi:hypothetical protein